MPTLAELDRLKALIGQLIKLRDVARGELIRAQDWNTIVDTLIEVTRAVIAGDGDLPAPIHEHTDQVSIGWLEPSLRAMIERGPLSDPAAVSRVNELERLNSRLAKRIDTIDEDAMELRRRITEISTRDLVRESEVTTIHRKIEGIADARDDVSALRATLRSIEENVQDAVEAGQRLVVDGEPVDIPSIIQRLEDVEALRERFRTSEGNLLDAATLEERFAKIRNDLVTEEELEQALQDRPGKIDADQLDGIKEEIRSVLMTEVQTSLTTLTTEIRTETSGRLSEVDALVATAVADSLASTRETLLAAVRPEIADAVKDGVDNVSTALEVKLNQSVDGLREELGSRIERIHGGIAETVRTVLKDEIPGYLDPITNELNGVSERLSASENDLSEHKKAYTAFGTEIKADLLEMEDAQKKSDQRLDEKLKQLEVGFSNRLDNQAALVTDVQTSLTTLATELRAETGERLNEADARVMAALSEAVNSAASACEVLKTNLNKSIEGLSARLKTDVAALSKQKQTFNEFKKKTNAEWIRLDRERKKLEDETLPKKLTQLEKKFNGVLDKRFHQADASLSERDKRIVAEISSSLMPQVEEAAAKAGAAALDTAWNARAGDIRNIAKEEISQLESRVNTMVDAQVKKSLTSSRLQPPSDPTLGRRRPPGS